MYQYFVKYRQPDHDILLDMCSKELHGGVTYSILMKRNLLLRKTVEQDREWRTLVVRCILLGTHTGDICKYEVTLHMATWQNQMKDTLVTLLLILTGFLFESLLLMSWIADEPFSLPDFPLMYLLSLKGMHDEGNYSCRLRGIQRVDDAKMFPTFRIQASTCMEVFLKSTFCPKSNFFFTVLHNVSFGNMLNMPSVVGPFSLKRDRMSWEEEISVTLYAATEHYWLMRSRSMLCTSAAQGMAWTRRTANWFGLSVFTCRNPTLMLTLKDQATLYFLYFSLGKPELNHVSPTRIAVGHSPSLQIELSSFPNSFPFLLTVGTVRTWSWWGTEPLWKSDVL